MSGDALIVSASRVTSSDDDGATVAEPGVTDQDTAVCTAGRMDRVMDSGALPVFVITTDTGCCPLSRVNVCDTAGRDSCSTGLRTVSVTGNMTTNGCGVSGSVASATTLPNSTVVGYSPLSLHTAIVLTLTSKLRCFLLMTSQCASVSVSAETFQLTVSFSGYTSTAWVVLLPAWTVKSSRDSLNTSIAPALGVTLGVTDGVDDRVIDGVGVALDDVDAVSVMEDVTVAVKVVVGDTVTVLVVVPV